MGNHAIGMDARIGSASTIQQDYLAGHPVEATFNFSLNSAAIFLPLPATKFSAIVAYQQFDVSRILRHAVKVLENVDEDQGKSGTMSRPVVSAKPHIIFIFCTACPDAPLTILSMVDMMIIRLFAGSILKEISQKFDPLTN